MSIAPREFRDTLGRVPTGVTVITTRDAQGRFHGATIGSFASLSLDPPLVLWSLDRSALCYPAFRDGPGFVVNVLAEDQTDLSRIFARTEAERPWGDVSFRESDDIGAPQIEGCLAHIECRTEMRHPGGDHDIFVGRVVTLGRDMADGRPLLHFGGAYRRLDPAVVE